VDAAHSLAAPSPPRGPTCARPGTKATRSQATLRNPPRCPARGPFSGSGWRGLTPRWPRSLRLGSASRSNLATACGHCKWQQAMSPHSPRKAFCGRRRSWMRRPAERSDRRLRRGSDGAARCPGRAAGVSPQNESDAVPGRLRNLSRRPAQGPFSGSGGAASHLVGLALCGSVPRLDQT
jgi:hypothetical protein